MVKTGIIRRFDDLGRIAVPKEVRKQVFGKTDLASVPMEFFYEKDGTISWMISYKKKNLKTSHFQQYSVKVNSDGSYQIIDTTEA